MSEKNFPSDFTLFDFVFNSGVFNTGFNAIIRAINKMKARIYKEIEKG